MASHGPVLDRADVNPILFAFQRDLVQWAVRKGRAALFADTGMGKTFMQVEWARLIGAERTLIVAPLSAMCHWWAGAPDQPGAWEPAQRLLSLLASESLGLVLFVITFVVLALAKLLIARGEKAKGSKT